MEPTPSIVGVYLQNVQVGGNLTISGVTVQLPAQLPSLWVNVPPLPNHFLGRDDLVDDLVRRLVDGHSPALSAEGLPGVGKTTLAVVLAHHPAILAHFVDGVLWAGLGPTPDIPSQLAVWAASLGIDVSDQPTAAGRAQAVRNAIGQRRLLLVIDDAWHADAAELMRCGGPRCVHLLTTRDQTIARRFAGNAQSISVQTLADDKALALLMELAPDVCAADPKTATDLARAVDGLPLALELLGGYLAAPERSYFAELSAAALAELADPARRLALAARRLGATDSAQVTLQETIALSLEGLPGEAVRAFHALGAFAPKPAIFSLEAAMSVTETGAVPLALLAARNLLERRDRERLALHQVLADVAQTRLEPAAIQRHRDYYLALVDEDRGNWRRIQDVYAQVQVAWLRSRPEPPEKSRTLDFIHRLFLFQQRQGLWDERLRWVEAGLAQVTRTDPIEQQASLAMELGLALSALGDYWEAQEAFREAFALYMRSGNWAGMTTALSNIGFAYANMGDKREALRYFQLTLRHLRLLGDQAGEAVMLNNIGTTLDDLGEKKQALEHYLEALSIHRKLGNLSGEAITLNNIGSTYADTGELDKAVENYQQALPILQELGDRRGEATLLNNMGQIYAALDDHERALETYRQVLVVAQQTRNRVSEATVLNNMGLVYAAQGDLRQALDYYTQAVEILSATEERWFESKGRHNMALVSQELGLLDAAKQQARTAVRIGESIGHPELDAYRATLARIQAERGNTAS